MILGIGVDIISALRIQKVYEKYGEVFLNRIFHPKEITKAQEIKKQKKFICFLAKRFAAKEAIYKASYKLISSLAFRDIAVDNDENGAPKVYISQDKYPEVKNLVIDISLSDDYPNSVAFCVITRR